MERFLIVCGVGAAGCGARYLIALWASERWGKGFPYATLIVNVAGSFLIALVLDLAMRNKTMSPNLVLGLTTGFMGGFTTYSAFNYETTALAMSGATGRAAINVVATLAGCGVAGLLGLAISRTVS
jgi:CrcB protein